jgi:UTP--glucose-1-phosphate uridylyltransferase
VVPVAGLGTRLLPATRAVPKGLLPLLDRPVLDYLVEELTAAGMTRILLVTAPGKEAIEEHFRDDARVRFTRQPEPRGLGDAVSCAEEFTGGHPVVLALGDAIISSREPPGIVSRLIHAHAQTGADATLAVVAVPPEDVSRYGIVVPATPGERMDAIDIVEKPAPGAVPSRYAVAARYVLGPAVFDALHEIGPDASGEVQLTDALRRVIADGGRVVAVPLAAGERRHDTGTVAGYASTFLEYALRHPTLGLELRSRAAELLDELA